MSIRWKFVAVSVLLVFIPIFFLNKYSVDFFDKFTRKELEEHMIDCARILGREYLDADETGPAAVERLQKRIPSYADELNTRLRILSTNGIVVLDSEQTGIGRDLSDRPEVAKSMAGQYGAANKLTADKQYMYYYIALPIKEGESTEAIAYLSRHTSQIIGAINLMISSHKIAYAISIAVATAIAVLLALTMIHPLRQLTKAARGFARGNRKFDCKISGNDEIAQLYRAIDSMVKEIEQKNKYNRDFLATAAHELKTPLAAIRGAAEVLQSGADGDPGARKRFIENIGFETLRLNRIVGELLELTRIDVENVRENSRAIDYRDLLESAIQRVASTLPENHATIEFRPPSDNIRIKAVPEHIEQVMANLIENAARYTAPSGKIEIEVESESKKRVRTTVSDTGCGIDPKHIGKVFDRFFTTEPPVQSSAYGSGLGLAIVKNIIDNHGGEIHVESQPGKGARFIFTLPCL